MATDESTITENYAATIPAAVREQLDVQPGDKLRWTATEDGGYASRSSSSAREP